MVHCVRGPVGKALGVCNLTFCKCWILVSESFFIHFGSVWDVICYASYFWGGHAWQWVLWVAVGLVISLCKDIHKSREEACRKYLRVWHLLHGWWSPVLFPLRLPLFKHGESPLRNLQDTQWVRILLLLVKYSQWECYQVTSQYINPLHLERLKYNPITSPLYGHCVSALVRMSHFKYS